METVEQAIVLPTPEEFSLEVENRTWSDKEEDSYIHHTAKYQEELGIDIDDIKKFISPSLMDKIRHEAMQSKQLKERHTTSSVLGF